MHIKYIFASLRCVRCEVKQNKIQVYFADAMTLLGIQNQKKAVV